MNPMFITKKNKKAKTKRTPFSMIGSQAQDTETRKET